MSLVDLHLHTTASDGVLTPEQLVEACAGNGVRVLSVTDHDSTESLPQVERAAAMRGITVIPGVELGTDVPGGEIHLLAYFFDVDHDEFQSTLAKMRESRIGRARAMVDKMTELGFPITFEAVKAIAGDASIGRPHIAQALLNAGHVTSLSEAFDRFLGRNGPAYADRYQLTPPDAVKLVRRAGGLPVVAHPFLVNDLDVTLPLLVEAGLAGIECHYQGYAPDQVQILLQLANQYGLLPTGGSDYHGSGNWHEGGPGTTDVPWYVAERLYSAAGHPVPAL